MSDKIRVYTFYDKKGNVLDSVRAINHDEALKLTNNSNINFTTEFDSYLGAEYNEE